MNAKVPLTHRLAERIVTWLMLLFGCAPIIIILSASTLISDSANDWLLVLGLYTGALSMGFYVGIFIPKQRLWTGLAGLLPIIAAFMAPDAVHMFRAWWGIVYAVKLFAVWFVGLRASSKPPGLEFSPVMWMALAGVHALIALLIRLPVMENLPGSVKLMLNIIAPAYFLLTALRMNENTLANGAASRRTGSTSVTIRRRNVLLVLGAAVLTVGIANIGGIARVVKLGFGYIIAGIMWIFSKFEFAQGTEGSGGGGGEMSLEGLGEAAEPSLLAQILEKIFIVIAIIIGVAAVCVLLWLAGRALKRLFKRIAARFAKLASELNQGYTDEAERILDWDELTRNVRERLRGIIPRRERLPKWGELDNRARVRLAVKALMRKKADLPESSTVRQALARGDLKAEPADAGALAAAYDAARYSDGTISDAEAENARLAFEKGR
ncbi:hypothetical protein AGMMS49992_23020 [Clostridia bacterium]|nr:hypothetical protein AGMMS49992_23020 [Clostridia bacterium]